MTFFPTSVLEAADSGETPVLRVSTKYMETFLPVKSVSAGTEIHTFLNRTGGLDLYSVGTDAQVYRLRRGQGADAPYDRTPLGVIASQLYLFTTAGGDSDTPSIFGLNDKGKLSLSTYQSGAGYVQQQTEPRRATEVIRRFLGVRGITGRIYINVRLDDGSLATNYYDPATQAWGGEVWAPVEGPDGKPAKVKEIAMTSNNPVQSALFAIGMNDEVLFAEDSFRTSKLRNLGKRASDITVVTDSADLLCIFIVEQGTGLLWLKKQRKFSTGGIQFDDWVRVDPSQTERLVKLRANLRMDGLVEVFATDEAGTLIYTRQAASKGSGWVVLFPIDAGVGGALFATGRTRNGYSEAYSVTRDGALYRFWQSPESQQWFTARIEVPDEAMRLASVPTHAAELTVVDKGGLPVAGGQVVINTAFLTTLWVDGKAYRSSMLDPVSLKTGANGVIVVHQRATALAAASLLVQTPDTLAGAPVMVEPNAQLQQRLANLDAQQVLDAKDASDQPLLPIGMKDRDAIAESIAQITRRSMDIAQAEEPARAVQYKFTRRHRAGFRMRADLSTLGEQAWEIDFSAGYPKYRDMSVAEAQSWRTDRLAAAEVGGFLGIDWGAVWNAIKSGVEWVIRGIARIVVTIVNGIVTVLFEIAGKIFEAVLEVIQQAFDFVEGVWNWLKVKLEQLYEWLAFLFNIEDFKRTAEGVKHTFGVILDFTADAVHHVRDQVASGFDTLKANLDRITNDLIAQLNRDGDPSIGGFLKSREPNEAQSHANDHNIFFNAFQQNEEKISTVGGVQTLMTSTALDSTLESLLERMKELANNFEFGDGKRAFDEAFGYFSDIGSDRGRALELLLSGLIKVFEGVAMFAIDFAKGVVLTLFDLLEDVIRLVREALFAEWEIPIVSQLYELFTGRKLTVTPVDVMAWIVGIPATILSKVVLGRSPYPDQAALDSFRAEFTVEMLKQRIGITPAGGGAAIATAWNPAWKHNFLIGYCCAMFVRALAEPGQVIANATGKGIGEAAIVPVVLRFMTTAFTAPWALSAAPAGPTCKPGEPGFGVTIWICQLFLGPTRGLIVVKQPWIKDEAKIYTAELTITLWGVANLIMTAWNFGAGQQTKADKLGFARSLTNLIPGQTLRFLAVPALNKGFYFIPAGVLAVLTAVGYLGSFGIAIAEINDGDLEPLPSAEAVVA
jgi:hypothetical protein